MTPREIFLNGCNEIAANFADFKPAQKGQKLSKKSADKDVSFEIYFQSSMHNYGGSVEILPLVASFCKSLKKLMQEVLPYATHLVFAKQLGYLTPHRQFRDWQLAGASFDPSVREISAAIKDYALPIFELFEDKQKAAEFMMQRGTKFNPNLKDTDLYPIFFMFYFGGRDAAEAFFNVFLNDCSFRGRFYKLYDKFAGTSQGFDAKSFVSDAAVKFAFLKWLKILNH